LTKRKLAILLAATLCGAVAGAYFSTRVDPSTLDLRKILRTHWPLLVSCGIWALWSLYWEAAAKNAAPAKSSESEASRGIHVFLTNAALLLELVPAFGRYIPASALLVAAGLIVQTIGLLMTIWARRHLGRNWSGRIAIQVEHRLIRSGPYRWVRHPIYTGILAMYLGTAFVSGEWLALIGLAMAVYAYWRKIRLEEANLAVAFGAEYDAYRQNTWALAPGLF
jgi:protein-S-isoprenylcysteine O-methyltransferase Ste14